MSQLGLHNLVVAKGSKKKILRVGRGNASKGTTAGRGTKGQRARSGGRNKLTLKGMKTYLLRIPKSRGFRSLVAKPAVVTLQALAEAFSTNSIVTPRVMQQKGLIKEFKNGVKVLAGTKFEKKMVIEANAFSKSARADIVKAGGQAKVIKKVVIRQRRTSLGLDK